MSVPSSVEELLQLIRKSGMVDDAKLTNYLVRRQVGRGELPTDVRDAADALVHDGVITYFQAEQFLLGKWRGFTIGKYKLLERVGVGGMGQVFLAEHMYMKRHVAVKVLPPAKAEQPAALGRFYREARAAGSLEHRNIVRTLDIDQDGNLHYIVMEYVNGSNLLDVVRKFGPMDVGRAAHYARQIALGLDYAFRAGIIHRDVKPGNVLLDRDGAAKILDMGLARFYNDTADLLTVKYDDKIVLGTADYVAPEQVAHSHGADVRADVYGLGASLYFLLAGHPPFPSGTVSQKLLWHRTKDPTPIRQIRPEVPEGLAAVVTKMMAKNPADRYQTPAEAAAALAPWVPAVVPPPADEEMPQLSPAATEALGVGAREPAPPEPVALAAGAGDPAGGKASSVVRSTLLKRPQPPAAPVGDAPRPGRLAPSPFAPRSDAPATRSPFSPGPQVEVPTNGLQALDPTPNVRTPTLAPVPLRAPSPAPFAPATGPGQWDSKSVAFAALLVASVVLSAGLMCWKFLS